MRRLMGCSFREKRGPPAPGPGCTTAPAVSRAPGMWISTRLVYYRRCRPSRQAAETPGTPFPSPYMSTHVMTCRLSAPGDKPRSPPVGSLQTQEGIGYADRCSIPLAPLFCTLQVARVSRHICRDNLTLWRQSAKRASLHFSHFVARQIWRRRGAFPLRCRAHRL
jgi:hypothetical protein